MSLEHVLFFKLKPMTDDQWKELHAFAMSFKHTIPGIVDVHFGPTIRSDRAQGYTHGYRVLMKDEATLDLYGPHPEHLKFKELLGPLVEDKPIVLDWFF
eukprot:TRINITY_DN2163_c0_g1_i2.p1 TRINITY_DN2163_c0_g1~~TRINITY_DN2163_c0_g1_i2.p1  ORF type:complete len:110 (-),score=16.01 TRINITY_DN2163_c0_g1_i2:211-507(-)